MNREQALKNLQDAVLDEYNDRQISIEEMKNILGWCEKQKRRTKITPSPSSSRIN